MEPANNETNQSSSLELERIPNLINDVKNTLNCGSFIELDPSSDTSYEFLTEDQLNESCNIQTEDVNLDLKKNKIGTIFDVVGNGFARIFSRGKNVEESYEEIEITDPKEVLKHEDSNVEEVEKAKAEMPIHKEAIEEVVIMEDVKEEAAILEEVKEEVAIQDAVKEEVAVLEEVKEEAAVPEEVKEEFYIQDEVKERDAIQEVKEERAILEEKLEKASIPERFNKIDSLIQKMNKATVANRYKKQIKHFKGLDRKVSRINARKPEIIVKENDSNAYSAFNSAKNVFQSLNLFSPLLCGIYLALGGYLLFGGAIF